MKSRMVLAVGIGVLLCLGTRARAEVRTMVDHIDNQRASADFKFPRVAPPSRNDVVEPGNTPVAATTVPRLGSKSYQTEDGRYRFTIDTSETPALSQWADEELAPVVRVWYPKIVAMLPSEGYQPPAQFRIDFSRTMRGVAATGGNRVRCAESWFRQNLQGEAKGAVVHELVHVVQQYGRRGRGGSPAPGWLVEGIADYIRWFLYEPQTHGAEISRRALAGARYDASYRVTANFINWVVQNHDPELIRRLNAAARENRYGEGLWKERTGQTVQQLGVQWKESLEKGLSESRLQITR